MAERNFEKNEVLRGAEITAEAVVAKIRGLFDAVALPEFENAMGGVTEWIRKRLRRTLGNNLEGAEVHLGLNAYNRTHGLGIQSVQFAVKRGESVLVDNPGQKALDPSDASPTIGVISPGLISGEGKQVEVEFAVAGSEELTSFTRNLQVDKSAPERHGRPVRYLNSWRKLKVVKPLAVRTVLKKAQGSITENDKRVDIVQENRGVYVCEYDAERIIDPAETAEAKAIRERIEDETADARWEQ